MKKEFQKIVLGGNSLVLTISVVVALLVSGAASTSAMNAEDLDLLKIQLVSPGVSGAAVIGTDTSAANYYEIDDDKIIVHLSGLNAGNHWLYVKAVYGTNTKSLLECQIVSNGTDSEAHVASCDIKAVQTAGDGTGTPFDPTEMQAEIDALEMSVAGKADGSAYSVEEQGDPAVRDVAVVHGSQLQFVTGATPKFAIDASGNLVLYNEGTPVVLTPAKLAQLIA